MRQDLKSKRHHRKNNSSFENRDGNSRSYGSPLGVSNSKARGNYAISSSLEEPGSTSSRKKLNKGSHRQLSYHKQRFFSSNFRNHGTGRNVHGIISESPPSNSVGYYYGSTPPESHGLVKCCCFLFHIFPSVKESGFIVLW